MKAYIRCFIISGLFGGSLFAGDLTPPGAPAPTMKPLSDIEPRTAIRQADIPLTISAEGGSYYLAESITMAGLGDAITLAANNITIDLKGYTITGPGNGVDWDGYGINYSGDGGDNITIENGTIRNFPYGSIRVDANCTIVKIKAESGFNGIYAGNDSIVENCIASRNRSQGIIAGGIIRNCIASHNDITGISIRGFAPDFGGSVVSGNTCSNNRQGINIASNTSALVTGNVCSNNSFYGIQCAADANARIEKNNVTGNSTGIWIHGGNNIAFGNTAQGNSNDYSFSADSTYGPIVLQSSGVMATTNPYANIRF